LSFTSRTASETQTLHAAGRSIYWLHNATSTAAPLMCVDCTHLKLAPESNATEVVKAAFLPSAADDDPVYAEQFSIIAAQVCRVKEYVLYMCLFAFEPAGLCGSPDAHRQRECKIAESDMHAHCWKRCWKQFHGHSQHLETTLRWYICAGDAAAAGGAV